jgi:predicted nucleic acid-binding protein
MRGVLIDTGVLLDYFRGDKRAQRAMASCQQRAISVVSWLEVMRQCPAHLADATEGFLRTFERLSISESIADEALRLILDKPALPENLALTWASARVNQLTFLTAEGAYVQRKDAGVVMAYKRR